MSANNASLKPIKLYIHATGPNPWKVVMVLEHLQIPYTKSWTTNMAALKEEPFVSVNPNGRVPAIEDPNTNITLWESGAILQYLVATYDPERKISFAPGTNAFHLANQWLFFQVSGQGPYYGQAAWFIAYHSEKLPSAIERYQKEAERIVGVIDRHLKKNGLKYLVADDGNPEGKFTFADISFVPWANALERISGRDVLADGKYEAYREWFARVTAQDCVKKALEIQKDAIASS